MPSRCNTAAARTSASLNAGTAVSVSASAVAAAAVRPVSVATSAETLLELVLGIGKGRRRRAPARKEQRRLGAADVVVDGPVSFRLANLLLERSKLQLQARQDVVEAFQVGLGAAQAKLGLVAARVQADDTSGLFEQRAAVHGLGRDDLAHPALADERG